jgi:hypothetical protein
MAVTNKMTLISPPNLAPAFEGDLVTNIQIRPLRFETLDHGGEYPDTMPQAIKLIDAEGRSCIYVPIMQNGKVVDSQGYVFDPEDE